MDLNRRDRESFLRCAEKHRAYFKELIETYPEGGLSAEIGLSLVDRWSVGIDGSLDESLALYLETARRIRADDLNATPGWGAFRIDLLAWLIALMGQSTSRGLSSSQWRHLVKDLEATYSKQAGEGAATGALLAQCWLALLDAPKVDAIKAFEAGVAAAGLKSGQAGFHALLVLYLDQSAVD